MTATVEVGISRTNKVLLWGGSAVGGCPIHRTVSRWPGWRRLRQKGQQGGRACSIFTAPLWPASVLPLLHGPLPIRYRATEAVEKDGARITLLAQLKSHEHARHVLHTRKGESSIPGLGEREPLPHQRVAVAALAAMGGRAILGDDMGLGKSSSAVWAASCLGCFRMLIICPASVKWNWIDEVQACLRDVGYVAVDGTPKQRADRFAEITAMLDYRYTFKVVVINYDLLRSLSDFHRGILAGFAYDQALILDESHYVKSRKADRTQFVLENLALEVGGARVRFLLSGTPIRNTVDDLWSQVEIIRPGTWTSYSDYTNRYLKMSKLPPGTFGPDQKRMAVIPRGSKNIDELRAVMNTLMVRRKKEEVLDLPPKVHTFPRLEIDSVTKRVYKVMKEWALLELAELGDDTPIFHPQARSKVEAALRCEQLASGFVGGIPEQYLEKVAPLLKHAEKIKGRPRELIFPCATKLQWLQETIETIQGQGGRPVVFSRFNAPLFWLVEQYDQAAIMHGGLNSRQKQEVVIAFQNNQYRVLFVQVRIAEGFNLTNSQDVIFFGRDWSPAINTQAEDRCHRIGTKGTVNVQVPIVWDTLEKLIHSKLSAKEADAEQALRTVTIRELKEAL